MQSWPRYISPLSWRMLQIAAGSPLLPAHITSANLTLLLLTEKRVFKLCSKGRLLCLTNSLRYPPHNSHNASSCHIIWNAKDRITFNYKHILFSIIRRNIFTPKIIIYWDCRDVRCDTCIRVRCWCSGFENVGVQMVFSQRAAAKLQMAEHSFDAQ